jgi:hypothetical protein
MPAVAERASTRTEALIGRWLAVCVHPVAAWRTNSRSLRLLCVSGYFAGGYILVLLALGFL